MLAQGFGRVLVAVYAVFAIAATGRSVWQIYDRFGDAPLAFTLSAVAAVVYIVAVVALVTQRVGLAWSAIAFEFCGVVGVGTWSVLDPGRFPEATVWSEFGSGYGYVPLVLPLIGAWWLRRNRGPGDRPGH